METRRFAYAASANKTDLRELQGRERTIMGEALKEFSRIGVRDTHTLNLVKSLLGESAPVVRVLDPVLALGSSPGRARSRGRAVLCVWPRDTARRCALWLRQHAYEVLALSAYCPEADLNLVGRLSPHQWAQAIAKSDLCVTDRYHATIYAILSRVRFLALDQTALLRRQGTSKLACMLGELGLEGCTMALPVPQGRLEEKLAQVVEEPPDFDRAHAILAGRRQESLEFLRGIARQL